MPLKLNQKAFEYAKQLIQQGRVDTQGDWNTNKPTPASEDEFLKTKGYTEYGKWFLGENTDADQNTKARYEFPFGNFKKVLRSGLIAIEQRAGQYHHEEIKQAAKTLLDLLG